MKTIQTDKAPKAVGPYSQAIETNGFIFCSGQIGIDPTTGEMASQDIVGQTERVLKNLTAVLKEAGSSLEKVVQTTCYLKNISDYQKFNEVYAKFFEATKPARATIEVAALPKEALVEISAIAKK